MNELDPYLSSLCVDLGIKFKTLCEALRARSSPATVSKIETLKYSAFYSNPFTTLAPGRFYLMGLNPGGHDIDRSGNAVFYEDESMERWRNLKAEYSVGRWRDDGRQTQLQYRITTLIEKLQADLGDKVGMEHVFSANLYFYRTPGMNMLYQLSKLACEEIDCWPIHQEFLRQVAPEVIITIGNADGFSSFDYLSKSLCANLKMFATGQSWNKRARIKYRHLEKPFWGRPRAILIGLPHLSRFWCGENRVMQIVSEMSNRIKSLGSG